MCSHEPTKPSGAEPFATVRMPLSFYRRAVTYLNATGQPACDGAILALFQVAIDRALDEPDPDDDPPTLDPGGGMRSPDEAEDPALDEGGITPC